MNTGSYDNDRRGKNNNPPPDIDRHNRPLFVGLREPLGSRPSVTIQTKEIVHPEQSQEKLHRDHRLFPRKKG